jgi:lipopolysaccharide transport system ATP-binding protein
MSEALKVESVSKCFKIHRDRPTTLKESIVRYLTRNRHDYQTLWALRDVSFSLEQGQVLGIIGHNGAGKSTLLRLLCGLGRPTSGGIFRRGYVSGLLELGSGLHFDMTGRENILTAGILNGLTKREVLAQQDEIISFAELEDFIDQPIRTYSSGMYLRLAFSTAIHFDPDILMVDEVLAVGDSRFQQKCMDRLSTFRKSKKTLVLVSHNMDQVRSLCDEALVLEEGRVVTQSAPEKAITCYNDLMRRRSEKRAAFISGKGTSGAIAERGTRLGTQEATIDTVQLYNAQDKPIDTLFSGDGLEIVLECKLMKPVVDLTLVLGIYSEMNVKCFETVVPSMAAAFGPLAEKADIRCDLPELPLLPGRYQMVVGLYPPNWDFIYDYHWDMHVFHVLGKNEVSSNTSGVVNLRPVWSVQTHLAPST